MDSLEDMADVSYESVLDSPSIMQPLDTPSPILNLIDLDNDRMNSDPNMGDLLCNTADPCIPSTNNLLSQMLTQMQKQDKRQSKLEEIVHSQGLLITQMNQRIELLERIIQNCLPNVSDCRLSTNETLIENSNQLNTANRQTSTHRNILSIQSHTRSLSSVSNLITIEENHKCTTNDINTSGQLIGSSDEIDKILSEKYQGKIQIGQFCHEINVGARKKLSTSPDRAASSISTNTPIIQEQQQQQIIPINYQLSRQLSTTNVNLNDGSVELSLLHPLKEQLESKTDRPTKLMDSHGKPPVIIICTKILLNNYSMEISAISRSIHGDFYSLYHFPNDTETMRFPIKPCAVKSQRIPFDDLKIQKKPNYAMLGDKTHKLKHYPSDKEEDTKLNHPTEVIQKYNLKKIQLAIRIIPSATSIPHPLIFYSNILSKPCGKQTASRVLNITLVPSEKTISFDDRNRYGMRLSAELPEELHCTLASGYKWFEMSILTGDNQSSMYYIDFGNNDQKNPYCFNITDKSIKKDFEIVKQVLPEVNITETTYAQLQPLDNPIPSETNLYQVHFQIRLLHCESFPDQSSKIKHYLNYSPWKSDQFHEDIASSSRSERSLSIEQETISVHHFGQKRMIEGCDYTLGLPITKMPKLLPNNEEYS